MENTILKWTRLSLFSHIIFLLCLGSISNAQSWTQVGQGVQGTIYCMTEFNGELYVAGAFPSAGGLVANGIAKWNGSSYSRVGNGIGPTSSQGGSIHVQSMFVYNNKLIVRSKDMEAMDGLTCNFGTAIWDGTSWSTVPDSFPMVRNDVQWQTNMTVYNGLLVIVGGNNLYTWDGIVLDTLPGSKTTSGNIGGVCTYNGDLYAIGRFGSMSEGKLCRWDGTNWVDVQGLTTGTIYINDMKEYNGELYVTGSFGSMGGLALNSIAKYNGSSWSTVGPPPLNIFGGLAFEVYGSKLFIAGEFYHFVNGSYVNEVIRWDGTNWAGVSTTPLDWCNDVIHYNNKIYAAGPYNLYYVNALTDLQEESARYSISIYPSPAQSEIHVASKDVPIIGLAIHSLEGVLLIQEDNTTMLDITGLDAGIYTLSIRTRKGDYSRKFVKQH